MSWGSLWGGGWGGSSPMLAFAVASALASSTNSVRVTFTEPPLFGSPIRSGDASNLRLFTLTRTDTGAVVPLLTVRAIQGDPNTLEFVIPTRWVSPLVMYQVQADPALLAVDLDPLTGSGLAQFAGMAASAPAYGYQSVTSIDLANPQTEAGGEILGGLTVATGGDYVLEGGESLLKKLIYRRITTALDEFYHLSGQGYGFGIQAKQRYTPSDVILLQASIQQQVLREPEVSAASVSVSLDSTGVLTVFVKATLRLTGQQLTVTATRGG